MLFLIASTHTEENCPGYNKKLLPEMRPAIAQRSEIAERHNVKLHWLLSTAPDHTFYTLVEGETQVDIDLFIRDLLPIPHANRVIPVISAEQLEELTRRLGGQ